MELVHNRRRKSGIETLDQAIPFPSADAKAVATLLAHCPAHVQTPLVNAAGLAESLKVAALYVKDERRRMGLGSFKALGAAYVIACDAQAVGGDLSTALNGHTYVTASAGNHGMSVAAGASVFGADAVIYLSETVPASFAAKLKEKGATVVIEGDDYEASMAAAIQAAQDNGWRLLSDSSWDGYTIAPHRLMEGYLQMAAEAFDAIPSIPTHIVLQAGVGGLAGAIAALARDRYGDQPTIIIVEPDAAPALMESIKAGHFVPTSGPVSNMGRLDCKEASLIALKGLSHDADYFVTISDEQANAAMKPLADAALSTTQSGGAGLAALMTASAEQRKALGIDANSRLLAFVSEEP